MPEPLTGASKVLAVRVSPATLARLRAIAAAEGRRSSVSKVVRRLIDDAAKAQAASLAEKEPTK